MAQTILDSTGSAYEAKVDVENRLWTNSVGHPGSSALGVVSTNNTSNVPLLANGSFTGSWEEVKDYSIIYTSIRTDQDSINTGSYGFNLEFSQDATNVDVCEEYAVMSGTTGAIFSTQPSSRYFRINYINGSIDQGIMRLQTMYRPNYGKPSSHRINDPINDQNDSELSKSVLTGKSELDDTYENISTYRNALNVNSAWVHRKIVNETFHQHTDNVTSFASGVAAGATSVFVVNGSDFATGDEVKFEEGSKQELGVMTLTDVTGSELTLDRPIANTYTTAGSVTEVITNMAVSGNLTNPQIFEIDPPIGTVWQITRILPVIVDNITPDDGRFGGIPSLTNGVSIRAVTEAGRTVVFGNWKNNGDMKADMYDVTYSDKAPAGDYGVNGRWTFTNSQVVAEIDGDADPVQSMQVLIQDDLTDLTSFRLRAQGRVFSP